ncbi:hypothetical protein HMPREF0574_0389, partial [Mobiluncus curtisii subsp. curtisii ATCC 35241]
GRFTNPPQTHNLSFNPRMSRRENGVGGIKAMPSGHFVAETPNRKRQRRSHMSRW